MATISTVGGASSLGGTSIDVSYPSAGGKYSGRGGSADPATSAIWRLGESSTASSLQAFVPTPLSPSVRRDSSGVVRASGVGEVDDELAARGSSGSSIGRGAQRRDSGAVRGRGSSGRESDDDDAPRGSSNGHNNIAQRRDSGAVHGGVDEEAGADSRVRRSTSKRNSVAARGGSTGRENDDEDAPSGSSNGRNNNAQRRDSGAVRDRDEDPAEPIRRSKDTAVVPAPLPALLPSSGGGIGGESGLRGSRNPSRRNSAVVQIVDDEDPADPPTRRSKDTAAASTATPTVIPALPGRAAAKTASAGGAHGDGDASGAAKAASAPVTAPTATSYRRILASELVFDDEKDFLAEGTFGEVYRATYQGRRVAIKRARRSIRFEAVAREAGILFQLNGHPNLVSFIGLCEKPVIVVMELAEGGTLADYLFREGASTPAKPKPLPEGEVLRLARDIASGLAHIHSFRDESGKLTPVMHRDLNPNNILLTSRKPLGIPKIADLGQGKVTRDSATNGTAGGQVRGTLGFIAPEIVLGRPYDYRIDIFSFGMILWSLTTRQWPFADETGRVTESAMALRFARNPDARPSIGPEVDLTLAEIIRSCWATDPNGRPSMQEICEELQDLLDLKNLMGDEV